LGNSGWQPPPPPRPSNWRERFTLTLLADVTIDDEPLWLIDTLIPAGPALAVFFGKPKSGKTFVVSDMCCAAEAGTGVFRT
jgi:hypothetical protein